MIRGNRLGTAPGRPTSLTIALIVTFVDGSGSREATESALRHEAAHVTSGEGTTTVFLHGVGAAVRAALEIATRLPSAPTRVVMCAVEQGPDDGWETPPPEMTGLLARVAPGQVLVTAPVAVVAGPMLPFGVDLVDRGSWLPDRDELSQRLYELRARATDETSPAGAAVSNLEWARRAELVPGDRPPGERDTAVHAAEKAWHLTVDGSGTTVLVTGPSAAQSHAVTAEIALRLHAEGAQVLYGQWMPGTRRHFRAFHEALGVYADGCSVDQLAADLEGWFEEVGEVLPEVGARLGGPRHDRVGEHPELRRIFDALEVWVRAIAARAPTLLVLADLQWADLRSEVLLSRLTQICVALPLMVVVTAEDGADADGLTGDVAGDIAGLERIRVG